MQHSPQIFISYARADGEEHAQKLYDILEAIGYKCWWDKDIDLTKDFSHEIERAIKRSDLFFVLITKDLEREDSFVRKEIVIAQGLKKPIFVLKFPDGYVPATVITNTYIEFVNWDTALINLLNKLKMYQSPIFDVTSIKVAPEGEKIARNSSSEIPKATQKQSWKMWLFTALFLILILVLAFIYQSTNWFKENPSQSTETDEVLNTATEEVGNTPESNPNPMATDNLVNAETDEASPTETETEAIVITPTEAVLIPTNTIQATQSTPNILLEDNSLCLKDLDDEQQDNIEVLFYGINQYRVERELPPFVFNDDLCFVANEHASDISVRGITNFPLAARSNGTYVRDWLTSRNFPSYREGIVTRADVFASSSYTPSTIMEYLGEHRPEVLEFTNRQYRELGIAYRYNSDRDTYYYVFISASRPNILPIIIANPDNPVITASTSNSRDVILWINSEYNSVQGLSGTIDSLRYIRISEIPPDPNFSCEGVESERDGWRLFSSSRVLYQLELGVDIHTVYVQMCDQIQTGHYEEAQIYLISDNTALAEFSVSPEGGIAPLTLQFHNQSINALSYEWDFNGDTIPDSLEENPTFIYQTPGTYTITLTAYGQVGEPSSYSLQIQIDAP